MIFNSAAVKYIRLKHLLMATIRSTSSAQNHQNFLTAKKDWFTDRLKYALICVREVLTTPTEALRAAVGT